MHSKTMSNGVCKAQSQMQRLLRLHIAAAARLSAALSLAYSEPSEESV